MARLPILPERHCESVFHDSFGGDDARTFGLERGRLLIEEALENSFTEGRATVDLARFMQGGVPLSTSAFTREIVNRIEKSPQIIPHKPEK